MPETLEPIVVTPRRGTKPAGGVETTTGSFGADTGNAGYSYTIKTPSRKRGESAENMRSKTASSSGRPERRIDAVDGFVVGAYALALDCIGILIIALGGEDLGILDTAGAPINFYFWVKGIPKIIRKWSDWTSIAEIVPFVGVLPLKFIGVLVVLYYDSNPEKLEKLIAVVDAKAAARAKARGK